MNLENLFCLLNMNSDFILNYKFFIRCDTTKNQKNAINGEK